MAVSFVSSLLPTVADWFAEQIYVSQSFDRGVVSLLFFCGFSFALSLCRYLPKGRPLPTGVSRPGSLSGRPLVYRMLGVFVVVLIFAFVRPALCLVSPSHSIARACRQPMAASWVRTLGRFSLR